MTPPTPRTEPEASRSLAEQINALINEVWVAVEREGSGYDEFDITGQQHVVLTLIARQPGITASTLADALGVTKGAVSQHLATLEQEGFITQRRSSRDRRSKVIELGERGCAYRDALKGFEQSTVDRYLTRFSPDDLAEIVHALQKLLTAFDKS